MEKRKFFKCEICGEETPIECEGAEPNTCAMCCPLDNDYIKQGNSYFHKKYLPLFNQEEATILLQRRKEK